MSASDTARTELRTALLAATEDRPAHRAFADQLIEIGDATPLEGYARWDAINEAAERVPAGVSNMIADALTEDILWLLADSHGPTPAPFPNRYRRLRTIHASAAARRRETAARRGPKALADRLSFLNR